MSSRPSSSRQQAASGAAELARSRATAMWLDAMRVQAVKELLNISQADRATTKKEVLEERQLVVRFFSVIGAAMHDLPAELVGVTRALVDVGLLEKRRSGEIILQGSEWLRELEEGGEAWETRRQEAVRQRTRVRAWAHAVQHFQAGLRDSRAQRSGSSAGGSERTSGDKDADLKRLVAEAVQEALSQREALAGVAGGRVAPGTQSGIRVAAAEQAVDLVGVKHDLGRRAAERVEPWNMKLVVENFPKCERLQCGLEDLAEAEDVRRRHLWGYIELARGELQCVQQRLEGVPGAQLNVFDDSWLSGLRGAGKRKRRAEPVASDADEESDEKQRAAAKEMFRHLRTATDEEIRRAMDGSLSVRDITRPSGEIGASQPILPAGGARRGFDVRVCGPQQSFASDRAQWRLDPARGLVLEGKQSQCRTWDEWDDGFTMLRCAAPEGARGLLLHFRRWMKFLAQDFSFEHVRSFYDHFTSRMEKDSTVSFEMASYTALHGSVQQQGGRGPLGGPWRTLDGLWEEGPVADGGYAGARGRAAALGWCGAGSVGSWAWGRDAGGAAEGAAGGGDLRQIVVVRERRILPAAFAEVARALSAGDGLACFLPSLVAWVCCRLSGRAPAGVQEWLAGARLLALLNDNLGVNIRPIACDGVLRILVAKVLYRQHVKAFRAHFCGRRQDERGGLQAVQVGVEVKGEQLQRGSAGHVEPTPLIKEKKEEGDGREIIQEQVYRLGTGRGREVGDDRHREIQEQALELDGRMFDNIAPPLCDRRRGGGINEEGSSVFHGRSPGSGEVDSDAGDKGVARVSKTVLRGALIFAFMGPHATPAVLKTWGYSCLFELFGIEGVRLLAFKTAASFLMNNIDAMIYNDNSISSWYEGHFASHMQVQYHAIAAVGSIHEVLKGLHIQGEYNSMDRLEFRYRDRKQMQEDDTVGDDYDFDIDLDMEMDA
ncbi:hypothetical protein CYMTET_6270 [Cymbomonas tetramitiformis]|uniref:Uncharacterized protein n=1 Tax=Cymbomonas tetramitiformis TaxID=36881 RepID=A0AAE0GXI4_9CHLO|nr:hypothetical protein CYMTET_6270 [Cymbomonas tetramitiformis]